MKTKSGVLFIVLLTSIILGAAQPARLYAGETPSGNLWDPFVNINPFRGGTSIPGTLTIIYNPLSLFNFFPTACSNGQATMFYSLRLTYNKTPYTYQGATQVCLGDIGTPGTGGQGDVILSFLNYVMLGYFPSQVNLPITRWNLKSVNNPGISTDSLSFVADIVVAVK
jgi:hypothetical protein